MDNTVKCNLMRELQEADFALYDTVLYLNTHPCDKEALAYYQCIRETAEKLACRYNENVAAITHKDVSVCGGRWEWIDTPWPWEGEI